MAGYTYKSVLLDGTAQAVAESATDQVISEVFRITAADSLNIVFDIKASAVTGTVTLKLQDSVDGQNWYDKKTVDVSATTKTTLKLTQVDSTNDAAHLPLRCLGRLVATTAGGEDITISELRKTERL